MSRWTAPVFALLVVLAPLRAAGHPLQFGVLHLMERPGGQVEASLRFSGTEAEPTGVRMRLPRRCTRVGPELRGSLQYGETRRALLDCGAAGLEGATVGVEGLAGRSVQLALRIERPGGVVHSATLSAARPAFTVPSAPQARSPLSGHLALGVRHILEGVDHLLFVLGLLLLVGVSGSRTGSEPAGPEAGRRRRWWRLIGTLTAFTVGHSVTLALATLGIVRLSPRPVEAVIALSILLLAVEIAHGEGPHRRRTLTARYPGAVAGAFGLLHGLGFAGALREAGLPEAALVPALLGFNLGVELGQILFVVAVLTGMALVRRCKPVAAGWPRQATVYAMGASAVFFLLQRLAG